MGLDNPLHIAFLVVILLLLFGAKRLPEIGRQLGSGMREFKDSVTGSSQQQPPAGGSAAGDPGRRPARPGTARPAGAPVTAAPAAAPAPEPGRPAAPAPQPASGRARRHQA